MLQPDIVANVHRAGRWRTMLLLFVGRVQVNDGGFAADGGEKLVHASTVGGLAAAGRTDNELGERHV